MIGRLPIHRTLWWLPLAVLLFLPVTASAQYFGRNKVNYERFDFRVLSTEHFDIYFYPQDNPTIDDVARMSERWYERLNQVFDNSFTERKPIILYSDHADFQQTNVLSGFISEGTGGVTEPIKNRVIMPMTGDMGGTDHVLGHELVHVFQFDIAMAQTDTIPFRINLLPLWLVEGMAEYLTVGRDDPHTAMWLRDAVLYDDFPSINALTTDPKYFPYRYGQALWAYVGGKWGDDKIAKIYRSAGRRGLDYAFARVLGVTTDSLSTMWADTVKETYRSRPSEVGKQILSEERDAGKMNLAPVLSPDGKQVAFISERDLFSIDVFVADAYTGKVQKRLVKSDTNSHFDALRFIDSAGAWSPDGKYLAVVVFAQGNNWVLLVDAKSGKIKERIRPKTVGSVSNPVWSPDGKSVVFSGADEGRSNLYLADVETRDVVKLTDDAYAELQPAWSPDGKSIAFVTDRGPETNLEELKYGKMRIGILDLQTHDLREIAPFPDAKHINPQFSPDGKSLFFISDHEGFSDVYRMELDTEEVYQVTRIATGVSGITALSPALTVSPADGRILFSVFEKGNYNVYALDPEEALGEPLQNPEEQLASYVPVPAPPPPGSSSSVGIGNGSGTTTTTPPKPHAISVFGPEEAAGGTKPPAPPGYAYRPMAGLLPPAEDSGRVLVSDYLADPEGGLPPEETFPVHKYNPKLQLDYIGGYAAGVAVDRFGANVGGGATAYFSDMLNNHVVGVGIQANGSFKDIGAQASYQNTTQRWNWAAVVGHVPYLSIYNRIGISPGSIGQPDTTVVEQVEERTFLDGGSLFVSYPFSTTKRLEFGPGITRYTYDLQVTRQSYVGSQSTVPITEDIPAPPGLTLYDVSLALVGDGSFHGFTSPIKGYRYRLEVKPTFGSLQYTTLLVDWRQYMLVRPFTFGFRGLTVGRYGADSEDPRLTPLFLGYETLVRGYTANSFRLANCTAIDGECAEYERLFGSRIAVVNLEARFPLFGTSEWGMINFPYLPTDLLAFFDGGVAWSKNDHPDIKPFTPFSNRGAARVPVYSVGGAARMNLLGALILEAYYVHPFQNPGNNGYFGLLLGAGW